MWVCPTLGYLFHFVCVLVNFPLQTFEAGRCFEGLPRLRPGFVLCASQWYKPRFVAVFARHANSCALYLPKGEGTKGI